MSLRTLGISPKVALPTLAAVAVGTALTVLGVLIHDGTVRDTGIGVLATAGIVIAPVGYSAPPGDVVATHPAPPTTTPGAP